MVVASVLEGSVTKGDTLVVKRWKSESGVASCAVFTPGSPIVVPFLLAHGRPARRPSKKRRLRFRFASAHRSALVYRSLVLSQRCFAPLVRPLSGGQLSEPPEGEFWDMGLAGYPRTCVAQV